MQDRTIVVKAYVSETALSMQRININERKELNERFRAAALPQEWTPGRSLIHNTAFDTEIRASTIEPSPFSSKAADLNCQMKESKSYELITTDAIASQPTVLSQRYVAC